MSGVSPASHWHLVGRDLELAQGVQLLTDRCGIMVLGDAGVGKTSYAASLAARLVADQLGDRRDNGELTRLVKLRASSALSTVALGALAPLLPPQSGVAPSEADMVLRAQQILTRQFRDRGALVVVDDVHLLDPLSAEVIHAMISAEVADSAGAYSSVQVQWLLVARTRHDLPHGLSELWASDRLGLIQLQHLGPTSVQRLLGDHLGDPTEETITQMMRATAGNPLLLHELIEGARSSNDLTETGDGWTLTSAGWTNPRAALAVRSHLGDMTTNQLDILEFLSLVDAAPARLVLAAFSEDDLAHLERRGLVTEREAGLTLRYGVHAQVLATEISERRRVALLHRVVTANLETRNTAAPGLDPLQLAIASWDLQANQVLSSADYLTSSTLAITNNDTPMARAFLEHVRDVGTDDRFELHLTEAQVLAAEGDVAQAIELLGSLLGSGGTSSQLHDATSALGTMIREFQVAPIASIAMIEDARFLWDAPGLEERLQIVQAQALVLNGLLRQATDVLADLDVADRDTSDGGLSSQDELGLGMVRMVTQTNGGLWADAKTHTNRVRMLDDGRSITVTHTVKASDALAEAFGFPQTPVGAASPALSGETGEQSALVFNALGRFLAGQRLDASRFARRAEQQLETFDPLGLRPVARMLADWADASTTAEPTLSLAIDDATSDMDLAARWLQLLAAWRDAEKHRAARKPFDSSLLKQIAERSFTDGWFANGLIAVHQLARHGEASAAVALLVPAMRAMQRSVASAGVTPLIVSHALGLAQEDPVRLLESAAKFWSFGWAPVAAESYLDAARFFDAAGDHHSSLMAALTGLEAASNADGASILLRATPNPLVTAREFEVASTIASGKSSKQAAEALHVSSRTIDNQVFRLCKRFDLTGRNDLVAAVHHARDQIAG